jgi:hypothetical protein
MSLFRSSGSGWKLPALFLGGAAVLGAALSCRPATSAQPVTFRFDPPDRTSFVQTVRTDKTTTMGSLGTRTEVSESKTKIVIKKTPRGYTLVGTPLSGTLIRDGKKVEHPVLAMLSEVVVTYELDRQGQIQSIKGYDTLIEKMKATLPPAAVQSLSSVLSEEALVNKEKADWDGRISSFVGQKAEIGDAWTSTDRYPMPTGGAVEFFSATKLAGQARAGGKDCVRIQFSYNSDANALKKFIGKIGKDISGITKSAVMKPGAGAATIVGSGERLIDPATMLIYSGTLTRTIKMPMEVPGQGQVPTTLVEKKEYQFDYGQ